jgi:transketolase
VKALKEVVRIEVITEVGGSPGHSISIRSLNRRHPRSTLKECLDELNKNLPRNVAAWEKQMEWYTEKFPHYQEMLFAIKINKEIGELFKDYSIEKHKALNEKHRKDYSEFIEQTGKKNPILAMNEAINNKAVPGIDTATAT